MSSPSPATLKRVYAYPMARIYPLYLEKIERKGRRRDELDEVLCWITGYSETQLAETLTSETTLEEFFAAAPAPSEGRELVTGVICGVRVEEIEEPTMQEIRRLDKVVDELAKGRPLEKIRRGT